MANLQIIKKMLSAPLPSFDQLKKCISVFYTAIFSASQLFKAKKLMPDGYNDRMMPMNILKLKHVDLPACISISKES